MSQSLLHQVCGWNQTFGGCPSPGYGLNPFFIRSAVGTASASSMCTTRIVSIPSSSGLRLERMGHEMVRTEHRSQSLLHQVCGWNFGPEGIAITADVSIPSSSGLRLELRSRGNRHHRRCLNPFFIRSAVGTHMNMKTDQTGMVSIPSSSGLRLERKTNPKCSRREGGLNPFFIRSAVGTENESEVQPEGRGVSIPSSSGLRLELRMSHWLNRSICLNPFFIRSAVGTHFTWHRVQYGSVSIPSSSGLRLEQQFA